MEKDPKPLVNAYETIEGLLNHVEDYVTVSNSIINGWSLLLLIN